MFALWSVEQQSYARDYRSTAIVAWSTEDEALRNRQPGDVAVEFTGQAIIPGLREPAGVDNVSPGLLLFDVQKIGLIWQEAYESIDKSHRYPDDCYYWLTYVAVQEILRDRRVTITRDDFVPVTTVCRVNEAAG